jgi:hypothetical protein
VPGHREIGELAAAPARMPALPIEKTTPTSAVGSRRSPHREEAKQQHTAQGIIFAVITIVAFGLAIFRYIDSKDQRSEIRGVLKKTFTRRHPLRSTIAIILWGLFGAILVFASELGLIFGGWQFLQGSKLWGAACAVPGAVIVALSIRGNADTWNPIRRAVIALKGDDQDRSVTFFRRLLEPARLKDQAPQH